MLLGVARPQGARLLDGLRASHLLRTPPHREGRPVSTAAAPAQSWGSLVSSKKDGIIVDCVCHSQAQRSLAGLQELFYIFILEGIFVNDAVRLPIFLSLVPDNQGSQSHWFFWNSCQCWVSLCPRGSSELPPHSCQGGEGEEGTDRKVNSLGI